MRIDIVVRDLAKEHFKKEVGALTELGIWTHHATRFEQGEKIYQIYELYFSDDDQSSDVDVVKLARKYHVEPSDR